MVSLMRFRQFRVVSLLPILLALGSCGPARNQFAPACPIPGVVKPLATFARYRGASRDVRDLIIRADITNVGGKCEPGDSKTVIVTAQVIIDLTRGPAMDGVTYQLPLFVAVTDADAIRDKQLFALTVEFPRNVNSTRAASQEIRMELPITPEKSAAAYGVLAGFQLTPEEVAADRQSRHR